MESPFCFKLAFFIGPSREGPMKEASLKKKKAIPILASVSERKLGYAPKYPHGAGISGRTPICVQKTEAKKKPVCNPKQASNIERRMEVKKVPTYVSHTISSQNKHQMPRSRVVTGRETCTLLNQFLQRLVHGIFPIMANNLRRASPSKLCIIPSRRMQWKHVAKPAKLCPLMFCTNPSQQFLVSRYRCNVAHQPSI